MEAIVLSKDEFELLVEKLKKLTDVLAEKQKNPDDQFLDNQEFMQLMNVSKRTAQNWRADGVISFSQIGSKIYYRMSDVKKLLDTNYCKAFKK